MLRDGDLFWHRLKKRNVRHSASQACHSLRNDLFRKCGDKPLEVRVPLSRAAGKKVTSGTPCAQAAAAAIWVGRETCTPLKRKLPLSPHEFQGLSHHQTDRGLGPVGRAETQHNTPCPPLWGWGDSGATQHPMVTPSSPSGRLTAWLCASN